jgi:hypothetical protein
MYVLILECMLWEVGSKCPVWLSLHRILEECWGRAGANPPELRTTNEDDDLTLGQTDIFLQMTCTKSYILLLGTWEWINWCLLRLYFYFLLEGLCVIVCLTCTNHYINLVWCVHQITCSVLHVTCTCTCYFLFLSKLRNLRCKIVPYDKYIPHVGCIYLFPV